MSLSEIQKERNEQCRERHELAVNRIRSMVTEETVEKAYVGYFQDVALFLLELENTRRKVASGEWGNYTLEQMRSLNEILYSDILDKNYERSYANPEYAVSSFGTEMGQLLSLLYAELRGGIHYAFEEKTDYLTILYELFIEVYNCFENAALEEASEQRTADEKESGAAGAEKQIPSAEQIREILYWYASDYCDVFLADRILEQIDPSFSFAADLIETADLDSDEYLYRFGEYISKNELGTAHHLRNLPQETLQKMADVYTEGYRIGFINTGKDLSKKKVVNIRYSLGFEKVVRLAIENFKKMGLKPVIYRAAASVITKREHHKIGYYGCIANQQYEYDHRQDQALFMDKRYIERKLEVMKTVYEQNRELAAGFAGPAVMEIFGETPFSPEAKASAPAYSEAQRSLALLYDSRSGQLTNEYIKGDERSFTIIAYPVPEIGSDYAEIFDEVIRINTLDAKLYEQVQQKRGKIRKRRTNNGEHNMFSGLLVCADCGSNLHFHFNQGNPEIKYFNCSNYKGNRGTCTSTHYVRVDFLEEVVLGEIRRLTKFASLYENEFVKAVIGHSQQAEQTDRKLKEKELKTLLARDDELDGLFERIYEDNVSGKLSNDRFAKMSRRYEDEQKELAEKIKKLRSEIEKQSSRSMTTDMFIGLVRKYTRARKLTPRMLNELVEKIEVFNAEKIDGVWEQRLRIHYNCVGTIEIPTVLRSRQDLCAKLFAGSG